MAAMMLVPPGGHSTAQLENTRAQSTSFLCGRCSCDVVRVKVGVLSLGNCDFSWNSLSKMSKLFTSAAKLADVCGLWPDRASLCGVCVFSICLRESKDVHVRLAGDWCE